MTEKMIKALESKGFHRWTKGDYDRLYANAEDFGLYTESYNSGNIRYAELNGVKISNAAAGRILSAKIYIDIKTDKLITSRITADADEIVEAVKAAIAEAKAEVESEEAEAVKADAPQLSEDAVREALIKYQSAEFETDHVDYYLHITADGAIVPSPPLTPQPTATRSSSGRAARYPLRMSTTTRSPEIRSLTRSSASSPTRQTPGLERRPIKCYPSRISSTC